MRDQINHNLSCTDLVPKLLAMRTALGKLANERKITGGAPLLRKVEERLKAKDGRTLHLPTEVAGRVMNSDPLVLRLLLQLRADIEELSATTLQLQRAGLDDAALAC
ncbi:hypothetical protein [Bradyrhizobium sp. SZCCHNS1054]|uniref:hypothetical protein n=1 Tax=Bradyrhizobium sp. SZCCHNS1054 TaxID=3057301 RepID=UPI002915EE8A|nr:hypothetical protein [Bradyrhizobium sp. SZCCHNS1054]